jgi:glycosyltransferase involved in cell wall biosynthesis
VRVALRSLPVLGARERALHVAQIGIFRDRLGRSPAELLAAWPSLVDVAEAAARGGARVSVIQACGSRERIESNGIDYHFLPFGPDRGLELGGELATLLRALAVDLLHVHGLHFPRELEALGALGPQPLLVQDHASRPPRWWRRAAWRRCAPYISGVAFCAHAQAEPFLRSGVLDARTRVFEIPESTSGFTLQDQAAARRLTGISGHPAVLWVGHLDANKDPLTLLEGIARTTRILPQLRLYCCFASAPLLARVQRQIATDERLRGRVQLLGRVAHAQVERLMHAADLFVSASHHEGSGYALIEALACGLTPVVSDIPSFRVLTGGTYPHASGVGRLWTCGRPASLAAALLAAESERHTGSRAAVRAHFDRELSFATLGSKLVAAYRSLCSMPEPARLADSAAPELASPPSAARVP